MSGPGKGPALVIAHRGASGYLPEHTFVAKALAHAQGADYLEQDVVSTRDGALIVFHDLTLDAMTDVAGRFPGRARADGHFYCIDFTLAEIRTLAVRERRATDGTMRYPGRLSWDGSGFGIPTFEEEIQFILGLNRSTGHAAGLYPEIKNPRWHREQGRDIGPQILQVLHDFGFSCPSDSVFLQCFEADELRRLRRDFGCELRMIQLLEGVNSGGRIPTPAELAAIRAYADGIGPSLSLLISAWRGGVPILSNLVSEAHQAGLCVHPYTLRADDLPAQCHSFDSLLETLLVRLQVDGVFTDFPDLVGRFIGEQRWPRPPQ
jgi:glycerophosphoryl diester phosphodiesterase